MDLVEIHLAAYLRGLEKCRTNETMTCVEGRSKEFRKKKQRRVIYIYSYTHTMNHIYLSFYLSFCLSIYLSIHPSIYLFESNLI